MLTHVMIGSNDLERSAAFYDSVFAPLGVKQYVKTEKRVGYRAAEGPPILLCPPFNGDPASFGNGSMLSFSAPSKEAVDAFHAAALAGGGRDEGAPGPRGTATPPSYMAYVRDPDGNKIAALYRP